MWSSGYIWNGTRNTELGELDAYIPQLANQPILASKCVITGNKLTKKAKSESKANTGVKTTSQYGKLSLIESVM